MTKQNKIFKVKALTDMATVHGKVKCGDVLAVVISNYPIMDLGAMMTATGRVVVEDCSEEEADLDVLIDPADMPANTTRTQPPQPPLEEPPKADEDEDGAEETDDNSDESEDDENSESGDDDDSNLGDSDSEEDTPLPEILETLKAHGVSDGAIDVLHENEVSDAESLAELINRPKVKGLGPKRREEIETALELLKEESGESAAGGESEDSKPETDGQENAD